MKKHLILMSVVLLGMFSFTSCDDDELERPDISKGDETISNELQQMAPSVAILHRGVCDSIYLGTTKPVVYELYKLTTEDNPKAIKYTTSHETDLYLLGTNDMKFYQSGKYLIADKIPDNADDFYVAALYLKDNPKEWYPVVLPIRDKYEVQTRATNDEATRKKRVLEFLGRPVKCDTLGSAVLPNIRWTDMSENTINKVVTNATPKVSSKRESYTGSTKTDYTKSWSETSSLDLLGAIGSLFINASATKSVKHKYSSSVEREWKKYYTAINAMNGAISYSTIFKNPSMYISEELSDALNGGDRDFYDDTLEGAFEIIDDFGTFLSTQGSFGAVGALTYERDANVSTNSLEKDTSLKLSINNYNGGVGPSKHYKIGDALMQYIYVTFGLGRNVGNGLSESFSQSEEEYSKSIHATVTQSLEGGNCLTEQDIEKWNATEDPNYWNLTSFEVDGTKCKKIIPLYYFIQNYKSPRGKLILYALTGDSIFNRSKCDQDFLNDNCPYVQYLKRKYEDINKQKTQLVVADVMLVKGNFKDSPKSFVAPCHDGVTRLFNPMITNMNAGDMVNGEWPGCNNMNGYGCQFGNDDVAYDDYFKMLVGDYDHTSRWGKNTLTLYYAMDYVENCEGIESIYVGDHTITGYEKRGDDFSFYDQSNTVTNIMNFGVYVKYVSKDKKSDTFPYVTGVSLVAGMEKKNDNPKIVRNWEIGYPIASTMYTEMITDIEEEDFNYYWNPVTADSLYTIYPDYANNKALELCVTGNTTPRFTPSTYYRIEKPSAYYGADYSIPQYLKIAKKDDGSEEKTTEEIVIPAPAMFAKKFLWPLHKYSNCIFINFTTKNLSSSHRSKLRTAKTWPYDVKK